MFGVGVPDKTEFSLASSCSGQNPGHYSWPLFLFLWPPPHTQSIRKSCWSYLQNSAQFLPLLLLSSTLVQATPCNISITVITFPGFLLPPLLPCRPHSSQRDTFKSVSQKVSFLIWKPSSGSRFYSEEKPKSSCCLISSCAGCFHGSLTRISSCSQSHSLTPATQASSSSLT